jgi:hypothetical protein
MWSANVTRAAAGNEDWWLQTPGLCYGGFEGGGGEGWTATSGDRSGEGIMYRRRNSEADGMRALRERASVRTASGGGDGDRCQPDAAMLRDLSTVRGGSGTLNGG